VARSAASLVPPGALIAVDGFSGLPRSKLNLVQHPDLLIPDVLLGYGKRVAGSLTAT
jgi:hypothetical protein